MEQEKKEKMGKQETEKKLNDGPSFPQDIPSHLWRAA
jgi:hypothetical protein